MRRIGICVGHSRYVNGVIEGGAVSVTGVNEHTYNTGVAMEIASIALPYKNVEVYLFLEYQGNSYSAAMDWVGQQSKEIPLDVIVELHFNSVNNPAANGREVLYWYNSSNGAYLASLVEDGLNELFPSQNNRGLTPIRQDDRGAGFLMKTRCPAIIIEPFFGSNIDDWNLYAGKTKEYASVIFEAICKFLEIEFIPPVQKDEYNVISSYSVTNDDGTITVTTVLKKA